MDGADRSRRAVVGNMAKNHSVRQRRRQVLPKGHLRNKSFGHSVLQAFLSWLLLPSALTRSGV